MTFEEYYAYFESIIHKDPLLQEAPYDSPEYRDYTKLNWSRMNRWLKKGTLSDELLQVAQRINEPQHLIVITEPWCGDAAHSIPFIKMVSDANPLIQVSYELRDSEPFRIENYLTRGSKSIPKLIYNNAAGADVFVWGPRPQECQVMYDRLKAEKVAFEVLKKELQLWYNDNKGVDVQQELVTLLKAGLNDKHKRYDQTFQKNS
ncbi:thioredoxin family protein [Chitinophaga sp.]|uniref:thioredoxin family protein n=1 Tax=Chitinophaga sp. TaxID=1869181 RepID=UPI0031D33078